MSDPSTIPLPTDADEDLRCPLCEYNLRGLAEPRCPECGHEFDWAALRFRRDHVHQYLFEHHPARPIRAFLRTLLAGLLPRTFWRTLRATHHTRRGRIIAYAVVVDVLATALVLAMCACVVFWWTPMYANWVAVVSTPGQAAVAVMREVTPTVPLAYLLAWPWLTLAMYALFLVSLGRANIRFDHVLRCTVYSADATVWVAPLLVLVHLVPSPRVLYMDASELLVAVVASLGLLWMAARLVVAARLYLSFRQSMVMALLTQVVVLAPAWMYWTVQVWFWRVMQQ